jgi:hypothetical protein
LSKDKGRVETFILSAHENNSVFTFSACRK